LTAGGRELEARRSPAGSFYLAAHIQDLTYTMKISSLCPEGAALFERHPPHFSTAVHKMEW